MQTYFGLNHHIDFKSCALTIGNFDGIHKGHSHILEQLKKEAKKRKLPTVLMTFEPLAKEHFARLYPKQNISPIRISPLNDKLNLIQQSNCIDNVIVINFNTDFSYITAENFVKNILIKQLHTRFLLIGDDFKFGQKRQGDFHFLTQFSEFETQKSPSIIIDGVRVSSSVIRNALLAGNFKKAQLFLGYPYFLSGTVKQGLKLGTKLNCPTANIDLQQHYFPLGGVYVVEVHGSFGCKRGVANFGTNPTINDDTSLKFEVHIFDFDDDLYGQTITVTFKEKIRNELKFDTLTQLQNKIFSDMEYARNWIETN